MKRITTLGATAAAVLALTALGAASASASSGFVAEPTTGSVLTLKGSPTASIEISTIGGEIECQGGEIQGTGPTTMFSMPFSQMSSTKNCSGTAELLTNGCRPTFTAGTETSKGHFQGTFDIGPAGCGPITYSVLGCTTKIGAQTGMPASFVNTGSGSSGGVSVSIDEASFTYSRSGACSSGTFKGGTLSVAWQVSGEFGGKQVGVHALGDLANGLQIASGQFEAERYSAGLGGSEIGEFYFSTTYADAECSGATLSGEMPSTSGEIKVTPSYPQGKCYVLGFPATSQVNGCQYAFNGNGTAALDCPPGASLQISNWACTVTIPEQTLGTATYKNTGSGTARKVQATFSGSSLTYSSSGSWCGSSGTANDGILSSDSVSINAFNPYQ